MATTAQTDYFILPAQSGSTRNLADFFPGKTIVIDQAFQEYVRATTRGRYRTITELRCRLSGTFNGEVKLGTLGLFLVDGSEICVMLSYLGGNGSPLLDVPPGCNEMNILLGYAPVDGRSFVFYVEHEIERGMDRIHLHAEPQSHMEDGPKRVIYFS
ncbi:hypothetical protein A2732_01645 [Candidatus Nomurabacteria bacterium RIFCSPHIGHO2_01_FULL_40_10]|nr:MAG: hypothetical protein A2732_01645 [Candidatus Nomurabacteria bacterium RIFCSPHIGHO2_01_FULL_40_10]